MRFAQIRNLCSLEDRAGAIQGCDCALMSNEADSDCDPSELKRVLDWRGPALRRKIAGGSQRASVLFGGRDVSRRRSEAVGCRVQFRHPACALDFKLGRAQADAGTGPTSPKARGLVLSDC